MKRFITIGVGLLVIIAAVGYAYWYFVINTALVSITYNTIPGTIVTLRDNSSEKTIRTVVSNEGFSVQKGTYTLSIGGEGIKKRDISLVITTNPYIATFDIAKSDEVLAGLLKAEEPTILAAITTQLPGATGLYTARPGQLYGDGTWYATRLRYVGTDDTMRDTLRLVMKKGSNGWVLVTNPPQIYLSYRTNPTIPRAVIDGVNTDTVPSISY